MTFPKTAFDRWPLEAGSPEPQEPLPWWRRAWDRFVWGFWRVVDLVDP